MAIYGRRRAPRRKKTAQGKQDNDIMSINFTFSVIPLYNFYFLYLLLSFVIIVIKEKIYINNNKSNIKRLFSHFFNDN